MRGIGIITVIEFLALFKKEPTTYYQIAKHSHWTGKKFYSYRDFCINNSLVEIDHIDNTRRWNAKYYRLTEKGKTLLALLTRS